jgi:spermidine synthase
LLTSILLVSASAIAYEILLLRLLSIVHWHHFAWMIISLALLGYGVSGTAIALVNSLARRWLETHFEVVFSACAMMFSVSMIGCFVLAQHVPFNALEVIWNPRQFLYLGVMYLLFMGPFFFAASCIGAAFTYRSAFAGRIYFFDLLGAGLGAVLVISVLFLLQPQQVLLVLAALALLAAWLAGRQSSCKRPLAAIQFSWLLVLLFLLPADRIELQMSEYKDLSQALEVIDSRVLTQSSSPLGLLTVVDSPRVPFRHAPGLSFGTRHLPPEQLAVFTDGGGMSVISRFDPDGNSLSYLADLTAALPYQLLELPRVLILGAGAGNDVLIVLHHDTTAVDAVELNPQMVALVKDRFADFSGGIYDHDRVSIHLGEARGFVARSMQQYDLIQIGLLDSHAVSGSGVQSLNESYLYTVEALRNYIGHLAPGGLLAITRWLKVPPRDSLKLAATAIEALRLGGVDEPGGQIVVIRNWNTATLLVKNGAFTGEDIETVREFSRSRSFDTAWYPQMPPAQANRFNRLERPWIYEGITALLGDEADQFLDRYKFEIAATTDDRPYFFHFFKWRVLPEVMTLRERGGAGLLEWGYLVLVGTMIQGVIAGSVLILLPLWILGRSRPVAAKPMAYRNSSCSSAIRCMPLPWCSRASSCLPVWAARLPAGYHNDSDCRRGGPSFALWQALF